MSAIVLFVVKEKKEILSINIKHLSSGKTSKVFKAKSFHKLHSLFTPVLPTCKNRHCRSRGGDRIRGQQGWKMLSRIQKALTTRFLVSSFCCAVCLIQAPSPSC